MAIHYLQQCKPPVVPVLQELYPEGEPKPEVMVDNWNVWFFEDIGRLVSTCIACDSENILERGLR
ncbi:terminal uridylyltransferase 7-like [Haemaphysalis longicornis]